MTTGYQAQLLCESVLVEISTKIRITYKEAAKDASALLLSEKEAIMNKDTPNREFMAEYKHHTKIVKVEIDSDDFGFRKKIIEELKNKEGVMVRRRLPEERPAITHKFDVGNYEGYLIVGIFDDGMPGELFIYISKTGSLLSGMMDAFAIAISLLLQYGVSLETLVKKFMGMKFEPNGFTKNKDFRMVDSIIDYIFKWLGKKFNVQDNRDTEVFVEEKINALLTELEEQDLIQDEPIQGIDGTVP